MLALDAIRARRTVREFTDQKIDEDTLTRILEAGRVAPSSRNRQPWTFLIVDHPADLAVLATVGKRGGVGTAHVAAAPVTLALTGPDPDGAARGSLEYDLGQASMSMQLAAAALGVGSCPSAVDDHATTVRVLGLPDGQVCPYLLTLGYPHRGLRPIRHHDRRPLSEVAVRLRPSVAPVR